MIRLDTVDHTLAINVIKSWDNEDFYYKGMLTSVAGPLNIKARRYPYLQTKEVTPTSKNMEFEYPLKGPIQVVYLDGKSDAGLPHTRGKTGIALPVFLLWHPSEKTMRHELVHLSQKQYPEKWWKIYEHSWSFKKASESQFTQIPIHWRSRRRINPDTLKNPYVVWKDRYIPLSILLSETEPDLRYCKRGFWDLKLSQWTWEEPPGWIRFFGSGFNDEHPNEIAAHWIDGSAGTEKAAFFRLNRI
jgi:hypothetical protein